MPKKKETTSEKQERLLKEQLKRDYADCKRRLSFSSPPTYFFKEGEEVKIGNRISVIEKVLNDGAIYLLNCSRNKKYYMWYDIRPINDTTESLVKNRTMRINYATMHIGSLLDKFYFFGTEMEPDYQRGYVWEEKDKVKLIDSIFTNCDIGKFSFIHNDYGDKKLYEILDGKQRMRTIIDFYENRFPYKGKYFNDLSYLDQIWFEDFPISVGEIPKSDKKTILKYFLLLNTTGKKMDENHLEKIKKDYENIKEEI